MAKKQENTFLRDMVKALDDPDTYMIDDGLHSAEFTGGIDTGSYILNALLSGSMFGGVPNNKITAFAGESATGKTFFVLGIIKRFLDDNKNAIVFYYDTEAAVTKSMMAERGIDTKRVVIAEMTTIQKFRTHVMRTLERYLETPKDERPPMMLVLDSLGMLSTEKEIADIKDGKDTRDMTRSQLIRGAFRAISLRLAKARAPMLVTNHTYDVVGAYVPTKEMSGGGGLKYAASSIIFLSKKKDREGTDVVGNIITCRAVKNRFAKENQKVDAKLSYSNGLDRYYGLLELAVDAGLVQQMGSRYQFPDGSKVFAKNVAADPEKYFTAELMQQLEMAVAKEFKYGQGEGPTADAETDTDE